ncbi:MAG: flagellar motor protein [Acidobacteriia bacterium]|nr:flagellar motor protein [Terriglobia bacterium]
MAEAKSSATKQARGEKPESGKGPRPDFATLGGLALAVIGILGGLVLEKGSVQDVAQITAALIVLGGTLGAVLVTTPLPIFLRAVKGLHQVFLEPGAQVSEMIDTLTGLATLARKGGIVGLELEVPRISDPFMRKALNLAIDGTNLTDLRNMMETDIEVGEQAEEQIARVWESAGGYAPTIGIIGAVLGLIQVMKNLDDIKEVGHGIAVAFVATVYGVGSANILFLPFASKIRARIERTRILKQMTLEGMAGIVEGLNPSLIRLKLAVFNPETSPAQKVSKEQVRASARRVSSVSASGV